MGDGQQELVRQAFEAFNRRDTVWLREHVSSELRIVPLRAAIEDTAVVARGVLRATARESGAPVETQATWTFTFRDGLIEEIGTRAQA